MIAAARHMTAQVSSSDKLWVDVDIHEI